MVITNSLLTMGKEHGRTGQALTPKGVCVHYVGNPGSTATANRKWFENGAGGAYTSAHYIIGLNGEILRLIPENERAQHAGKSYGAAWDKTASQNNASYIGIECCHPDAAGMFNDKTYAALIELCADICKRHGFDPARDVVRHYDITGKACPLFYTPSKNPAVWALLKRDVGVAMVEVTKTQMNVDGKTVDIERILYKDANYVKVRDLVAAMGGSVEWDAERSLAYIFSQKREG